MGFLQSGVDKKQPFKMDILKYLVDQGKATITFDDGSGAGGFAAAPSTADKAVLTSAKNDLSGNNPLKSSTTATDLIYIDLGDLYQIHHIQWRARIYFNGTGSNVKLWQYSKNGTDWVALATLAIDDSDSTYFVYPTMPGTLRYIRVRAYSTNDTNRDFYWGRMALWGDIRTVA